MNGSYPTAAQVLRVFETLAAMRDIIESRPLGPRVPKWCESRGWTKFLMSLSDDALLQCEELGLAACLPRLDSAPKELVRLGRDVVELTEIPPWSLASGYEMRREKLVGERKLAQIGLLVEHARELAGRSSRIVDFGCGRGHLTRLTSVLWGKPALGLELDEALVRVARELSDGSEATYVRCDARKHCPQLCPGDLAVGLHACGELGDLLVQAACAAGSRVLLVSCCPQKRSAPVREPLSQAAQSYGLSFQREVLGLANLTHRRNCLAAPLVEVQAARERRYAVELLLRDRGCDETALRPMRGLSRRRSYHGLEELAEVALSRCGARAPTLSELEDVRARASVEYAAVRRLGLARNMLSRLFELGIVLDRAACLMEGGFEARVVQGFDPEVSPRNLVLLACRSSQSVELC
jgi:hypothetical protein